MQFSCLDFAQWVVDDNVAQVASHLHRLPPEQVDRIVQLALVCQRIPFGTLDYLVREKPDVPLFVPPVPPHLSTVVQAACKFGKANLLARLVVLPLSRRGTLKDFRPHNMSPIFLLLAGARKVANQQSHVATMRVLLGADVDVEERDEVGRTPLMYAATWNMAAMVPVLLAAGARNDALFQYRLPLEVAFYNGIEYTGRAHWETIGALFATSSLAVTRVLRHLVVEAARVIQYDEGDVHNCITYDTCKPLATMRQLLLLAPDKNARLLLLTLEDVRSAHRTEHTSYGAHIVRSVSHCVSCPTTRP
jgi:hypothetical protein